MKYYRDFEDEDGKEFPVGWLQEKHSRRDDYQDHGKIRKLRSRRRSGYLRKQAQRQSMGW